MKTWTFAKIVINIPIYQSFYYIIPDSIDKNKILHRRVQIPFGNREEIGFVMDILKEKDVDIDLKKLKSIKEIDQVVESPPLLTKELADLSLSIAKYYHAPIGEVLFTMLPPLDKEKPFINPYTIQKQNFIPTEDQVAAFKTMQDHIGKRETFLLQGVTGSGKTEVYKLLADKCIKQKKSCIILVPEISLTDQILERFTETFGDHVSLFHSKLSPPERVSEWNKTLEQNCSIVIGPRSAIFAPVNNLGLIIIDEEHDPSYKAMDSPRYHARSVGFMRSKQENALLVLGSATPSIETRHAAEKNIINYVLLPKRYSTALPSVELVDLKQETLGNNLITKTLLTEIIKCVSNKKQVLIFLNRRGFSPSILCRDCGFIFKCPNCDISMTWYKKKGVIKCKYCDFEETAPSYCLNCKGLDLKDIGHGTEKLELSLAEILPSARILRLDLDNAKGKGSQKILQDMRNHKADILVGTQMIAKGHDIANVNLVGIIFPEIMLTLPDFRVSEKTFSLVAQAIGRSGRRDSQGKAIIQSYVSDHFSIQYALNQDYEGFYKKEIEIRKNYLYPPFVRMGKIVFRSTDEKSLVALCYKMKDFIRKRRDTDSQIEILGPCPCPMERINTYYRYHILLKSCSHKNILENINLLYQAYKRFLRNEKIKADIDIDPYQIL